MCTQPTSKPSNHIHLANRAQRISVLGQLRWMTFSGVHMCIFCAFVFCNKFVLFLLPTWLDMHVHSGVWLPVCLLFAVHLFRTIGHAFTTLWCPESGESLKLIYHSRTSWCKSLCPRTIRVLRGEHFSLPNLLIHFDIAEKVSLCFFWKGRNNNLVTL